MISTKIPYFECNGCGKVKAICIAFKKDFHIGTDFYHITCLDCGNKDGIAEVDEFELDLIQKYKELWEGYKELDLIYYQLCESIGQVELYEQYRGSQGDEIEWDHSDHITDGSSSSVMNILNQLKEISND